MSQYITQSAEETIEFGKNIGSKLIAGDLVLLFGDLGAGKTCLTKGICQGVGLKKEAYLRSPTFTLINEYQAKSQLSNLLGSATGSNATSGPKGVENKFPRETLEFLTRKAEPYAAHAGLGGL